MKFLISLFILLFLASGCSEDAEVKNFRFQIAPAQPPIIFADRTLSFVQGDEVVEVEINGPWMLSGFNVVNDNDRTITIVSLSLNVTGPDGKTREGSTFQFVPEDEQDVFGVFRAEGDLNCDGQVTPEDANVTLPAPPCDLDSRNPSFLGSQLYIHDLMEGVNGEDLDQFRGGSFSFEMRLEGWFGPPDRPIEGFFKIIYFTVSSST